MSNHSHCTIKYSAGLNFDNSADPVTKIRFGAGDEVVLCRDKESLISLRSLKANDYLCPFCSKEISNDLEELRQLRVFLCHAHADRDTVRGLYTRLNKDGVDAWLDKEKLLPGQDWELEIRKAVREADVVVVCLSKQFNQAGFRQKEVRLALETAQEKPKGEIFMIPARLEECENLEDLRHLHWVDLFEDDGYDKLTQALSLRAHQVNATFVRKLVLKAETGRFVLVGQTATLSNLGIAHQNMGDSNKAIEYFETALLLSQGMGDRKAESSILSNLGSVYEELGDLVRATELYENALKISGDEIRVPPFDLDSAGFLMIWVEKIQAYIHWLPVTKIEFEVFLSAASNNKFNDHWYDEILALNERVSPKKLDKRNYHQLFLTGIFPSEVLEFVYWLNENDKHNYYSIPTSDEWIDTYKALSELSHLPDLTPYLNSVGERASAMYRRVDEIMSVVYQNTNQKYTLTDQMLMKFGVMEWAKLTNDNIENQWAGFGVPLPSLRASMKTSYIPEIPKKPEDHRFSDYGFRLIKRPLK